MPTEKIDLHQSRDFSDIINVTFYFIQRNFRKLFFCVLFIVGPFALLTGLNTVYFQPIAIHAAQGNWSSEYFVGMGISYFIYLLVQSVCIAVVYHFIRLDAEEEEFNIRDVWVRVRKDLAILLFINSGALIFTLFALCCLLIPGIYTGVAFSIISTVWLVERNGFTNAVSRSFKLVSGRWWRTFGLMSILLIVQFLISSLLVVPIQIVGHIAGFLDSANLMGTDSSPAAIAVLALKQMLSMLCSTIVMAALVFHYYSLVEEKDGLGLMAKIRTMGTQPAVANHSEAEEEY